MMLKVPGIGAGEDHEAGGSAVGGGVGRNEIGRKVIIEGVGSEHGDAIHR